MTSATYPFEPMSHPRLSERLTPRDRAAVVRRVERLARVMDAAIAIPGLGRRIGWDALIGLIPAAGDTLTAVIALYPVAEALRLGAPRGVIARMLANVGVDWLVGSVPLAGDLFDVAFRANVRNAKLLRAWFDAERVVRT